MGQSATDHVLCIVWEGNHGDAPPIVANVRAACALEAEVLLFDFSNNLNEAREAGDYVLLRPDTASLHAANPKNRLGIVLSMLSVQRPGRDVLLLNRFVRLPYGFDFRLKKVAYAEEKIACVSPLTGVGNIFNVLLPNATANTWEVEEIDRLVLCLSDHTYYEVPFFLTQCAYIRTDALAQVDLGRVIKELIHEPAVNRIGKMFRSNGRVNVICDHTYVGIDRLEPDKHSVEHDPDGEALASAHPITRLRHSVSDRMRRGVQFARAVGLEAKPVQLHIMHSFGGGLEKWVQDYSRADSQRANLVLKSIGTWGAFGQRLALFSDIDDIEPIRVWDLALPVRSTDITNLQYQHVLAEIIDRYRVDAVLISSFIGHTLDILRQRIPTAIIFHDYYPLCPSVTLYFDGVCAQCREADLAACLKDNPLNYLFKDKSAKEWMPLRAELVGIIQKNRPKLIAPSPSVATGICRLEARLQPKWFSVIPHGTPQVKVTPITEPREPMDRMRVLVFGRMAVHKGASLLRPALQRLTELADVYMVGCGNEENFFRDQPGVRVIEKYSAAELPGIVAEIKPDLGLLLSVWPETFSYTLSELQMLGIPPLATRAGSFADRIEDGVNGLLFDPDAESLLSRVREVKNNPQLLIAIKKNLSAFRHTSCEEMVAAYHALMPLAAVNEPRYSLCSPYEVALASPQFQKVDVVMGHELSFIDRMESARAYLADKIHTSPRLRSWQRIVLRNMLNGICGTILFFYRRARVNRESH